MHALVDLEQALFEASEPATTIMYGFGGPAAAEKARPGYERANAAVTDAFAEAGAALSPASATLLAQAREAWDANNHALRERALPASGGAASQERDDLFRHNESSSTVTESLLALEVVPGSVELEVGVLHREPA